MGLGRTKLRRAFVHMLDIHMLATMLLDKVLQLCPEFNFSDCRGFFRIAASPRDCVLMFPFWIFNLQIQGRLLFGKFPLQRTMIYWPQNATEIPSMLALVI